MQQLFYSKWLCNASFNVTMLRKKTVASHFFLILKHSYKQRRFIAKMRQTVLTFQDITKYLHLQSLRCFTYSKGR